MIKNFIGTKNAYGNCYKDWKIQLSFVRTKNEILNTYKKNN